MNILITSVGRRTKLIEYFKKEFENVIVTDSSIYAPAIYAANKYYIVPSISNKGYIEKIKAICKENKIKGILSLIDPELALLSRYKKEFKNIGVEIIGSPANVCDICFDKWKMYNFLRENNIKTAKTYNTLEVFINDLSVEKIKFPIILKPATGSASIGVQKIDNIETLKYFWEQSKNCIIQEFLNGQEIGCDVYTDLISKKVVSIFTKNKLNMRAGETDKAVSFKDLNLFNIVQNFVNRLGTEGPIDIDIFKVNDEYYISEVNPRFGGGYLIAYECGENFPKLIKNNLENKVNEIVVGKYKENICMLKCDDLKIVNLEK